jgi:hypothetical protein
MFDVVICDPPKEPKISANADIRVKEHYLVFRNARNRLSFEPIQLQLGTDLKSEEAKDVAEFREPLSRFCAEHTIIKHEGITMRINAHYISHIGAHLKASFP